MAKKSNRIICLILTVLMIVGMIPVANAQFVYDEAKTTEDYYSVDYDKLVGTRYEKKVGVYIVNSEWEFKEGEAPEKVTFKFRGQEYTETYSPERHLFKFSDVYTKAKAHGVPVPTCILTEGNYSGNGTLTLSDSIILLGAKAGINPNVPNADPTKEWALNENRYYNDDIAEEDTGGESRLWTPGAENPDVGYVEGASSQYTDKILKITKAAGTGTFVIDGLFFQGYAACLDATANGTGTWNIYVQNCIFGNCYSYDTETLRFWNRGGSMSIAKKLYLSNSYVRDNNKNGFYSGHAQTIHVNGLCFQNSTFTCFYNTQNIPWQGYDFSCENSHFWQPDGTSYNRQIFDFNMTSYSNVGPGSDADTNIYSIKNNSFYNCNGYTPIYELDEDEKPTDVLLGNQSTSTSVCDAVIGGPNDRFTFEDNILINTNDFIDGNIPYSPLRLYFTCDTTTNMVTHGWGNSTCTTTMLDPDYILGENQVEINNNTLIGENYMVPALRYKSGGVLNAANKVEMEGNLYLPSLEATKGEIVKQVSEEDLPWADQFYDKWVWLDKAMTLKSSVLYENDFAVTAGEYTINKDGENWSVALPYNVFELPVETSCHADNSVKLYKANADFEKGALLDSNILDTSERTSYYIITLFSIDGRTTKDYKLTVNRAPNPSAALNDVVATPAMSVDLKEAYGDNGYRFEVNYDNSDFKFTLNISEGATATVKSKVAGQNANPVDGVYTIRLTNTQQDYTYVITVTDAEGNYEKYDLVLYRRLSTHADIEKLTSSGEVTFDEENKTYRIDADATAAEVDFTVKVSTGADGVLTENIYGSEIDYVSTSRNGDKYIVDVAAGENIFKYTVTAQNGVDVVVWTVIIFRPENTACELISIDNTVRGEDDVFTANVDTLKFMVNAVSSTASTYHIYKDSACTEEIANPYLTLTEAQTVVWLQIHAENDAYKSIPYKVVINTTADLSKQEPGVHYEPMKDNGIIGVTGADVFDDDVIYVNLPENIKEFDLTVDGKGGHQIYLFADPDMTIAVPAKQVINLDSGITNLIAVAKKGDDVYCYTIRIRSDRHYEYSDTLTPWAKPYIDYINDEGYGLLKGNERGAFNGEAKLNRYELATIMVRLSGANKDLFARCEIAFIDDIAPWAENYVKTAVKLGMINGYATYEGEALVGYTFQGDKTATRAEFIRVMMNVLLGDIDEFYKANEADIKEIAAAAELKDFDKVPNWAKSSMYTAIAFGYISGDENGNVNSDGLITRNEAATIIARLLQNVGM